MSNINEKIFAAQDLERAATRGMLAGQIVIVEDIIKQIRRDAGREFDAGHDEAAKALRNEADAIGDLIVILEQKKASLASTVRREQIGDTVIDASLTVHPDFAEYT